jgi:hypothetical protein
MPKIDVDVGVNLIRLPPGAWSSQRHRHSPEDEFVYVLEGELAPVEYGGETALRSGECAAFRESTGSGHHLITSARRLITARRRQRCAAADWQAYFGINTVSMTWIVPLLAATSAVTTVASSILTFPPLALMVTDCPFKVLADFIVTT